jgi:hypothetical protein
MSTKSLVLDGAEIVRSAKFVPKTRSENFVSKTSDFVQKISCYFLLYSKDIVSLTQKVHEIISKF